ncbi:FkbM family methyltransferase [Desulfovibrio psychrotolerans]|uniref:Methyltransferase n=1 Tax=Desulfovibrio psychrotolerans TaxID=415242 RepID=A0A7J0BY58_9BACT|nr:FkbM family methyltransferase [Desulfovibrio psychrotolerans]GFM38125.1 methyltransferase [Desulfovibrio psychrotolerans]
MTDTKRKLTRLYAWLISLPLVMLPRNKHLAFRAMLAEDMVPTATVKTKHSTLKLHCPGRLLAYRANTFHTKEPETLAWIDSFEPGDVFWDIGANVGLYSLYAGSRGTQVLSFEPAAPNFYLLCKNVHLNDLGKMVTPLCIALGGSNGLLPLSMSSMDLGGAEFSLNEQAGSISGAGSVQLAIEFKQQVMSYTIDSLVREQGIPFPNHIKVDVDGIEELILSNGVQTLADPKVKTLALETNMDDTGFVERITALVESLGFKLYLRERSPIFDNTRYQNFYNSFYRKVGQP